MVRVHIHFARQPEPVVVVEADEQHGYRIQGSRCDLIDPREAMLGLPSGNRVTADDAPEEWARGLILRYRSPDVAAQIVHDDEPLAEPRGHVVAPAHAVS